MKRSYLYRKSQAYIHCACFDMKPDKVNRLLIKLNHNCNTPAKSAKDLATNWARTCPGKKHQLEFKGKKNT